MRASRGVVVALAGSSLALVLLDCVLLVAERLRPEDVAFFVGVGCVGALTVVLGVIITWRVEGNIVGPLLTCVASAWCSSRHATSTSVPGWPIRATFP